VFRAAGVIVRGNRISRATYSAVHRNSASNIQITGNTATAIGEVAIYSEFGFEGAVIANNTVDGASTAVIAGNLIAATSSAAIVGMDHAEAVTGEPDERAHPVRQSPNQRQPRALSAPALCIFAGPWRGHALASADFPVLASVSGAAGSVACRRVQRRYGRRACPARASSGKSRRPASNS
jgi:putative cofactor-binding repeat protein